MRVWLQQASMVTPSPSNSTTIAQSVSDGSCWVPISRKYSVLWSSVEDSHTRSSVPEMHGPMAVMAAGSQGFPFALTTTADRVSGPAGPSQDTCEIRIRALPGFSKSWSERNRRTATWDASMHSKLRRASASARTNTGAGASGQSNCGSEQVCAESGMEAIQSADAPRRSRVVNLHMGVQSKVTEHAARPRWPPSFIHNGGCAGNVVWESIGECDEHRILLHRFTL